MDWSPGCWRSLPIEQQPCYEDGEALGRVLTRVRALPPLVVPGEIDTLRGRLAQAGKGQAFLLQGGDCAERFADCTRTAIEAKLKILMQMSLVLTWGARMPVVRVARMAGQYAKPRSQSTEQVNGQALPVYRGDSINDIAPHPEARRAQPERLLEAYYRSAATLNFARALLDGGFADLHHPDHWDLGFVRCGDQRAVYNDLIERMLDAVNFVESTGAAGNESLRTVELFSSHEALLLPYEEALTVSVDGRWYNLGAHMLWIGERTRQLDGAHVAYARGIENPVGIKIGPSMTPDALLMLLEAVEPANRPGRVVLITRMGADAAASRLPPLIAAAARAGRAEAWACDPMHGNTVTTPQGVKTRRFHQILSELETTFDAHQAAGSVLAGVHFELTGDDVTECTGGPQELSDADLSRHYQTHCDPRLNYAQSLEMAFRLAHRLRQHRLSRG